MFQNGTRQMGAPVRSGPPFWVAGFRAKLVRGMTRTLSACLDVGAGVA